MNELKQLTDQLQLKIDELKSRYLTNEKPENKRDRDFFMYVKDQTTPTYEMIQQWQEVALAFVKDRKVQVHPQQIESTSENLELLLMHSYYIDVKRKRYMELHHSIHYVFDRLLEDLESI
ncbi:DUF1798 family protein [Aquibacillus sediminis]|uniref:DUF1798 family protein n=1 Tax=Aquibacillus sediminis TaxID=2574734 RepID=UPI001107CD78|nr:DUF1798 family protein [Aquibacillus sediminis]